MQKRSRIIPFPEHVEYSQEKQAFKLEFSFGVFENGSLVQKSDWFVCREFVNDVLYFNYTNFTNNLYRFDSNIPKPDMFIFKPSTRLNTLKSNYWLLNQIEGMLCFTNTYWYNDTCLILPQQFLDHPFATNIWTMWIKILCQKKWKSLEDAFTNCSGNEEAIIRAYSFEEHLKHIDICPLLPKFDYKLLSGTYVIHGAGYAAFLNKYTKGLWKKDVEDALSEL